MDNKNRFISDKVLNKVLKILGVILLFLAVLYMLSQFSDLWNTLIAAIRNVLIPVALAWLLSLVIYPVIQLLERRGVGPRWLNVMIVYLGTGVIIGLAIIYLWPFLAQQVNQFFEYDVPGIQDYFQNDLRNDFILGEEIYDWIATMINESDLIESAINGFVDTFTQSISSVLLRTLTILVILPVFLFLYLKDYERVNDSLRSLIPSRYEKSASELGNRLNRTVGAYVRGQLLLMVAIGIAATVLYKIIGLQYFFIFGLIVGITNIIPYFGALLAMIPAVLYALIARDQGAPSFILVVLVNLALQNVEGNFFQPIIMGRQLQIHALLIIISILFFGSLFGTLGVIFASPIAATIRVLIEFYKEKRDEAAEDKILQTGQP